MAKLILSVLFVSAVCSAAIIRQEFVPKNGWSILKCKEGKLTGLEDFVEVFQAAVSQCEKSESSKDFYACVGASLAMTEEDGTPNASKIQDLYVTLFSELVLEDLPSLNSALKTCAQEYVSNYNEVDGAAESTEAFFQCFTQTTQDFSEDIESVCRYEDAFNGRHRS